MTRALTVLLLLSALPALADERATTGARIADFVTIGGEIRPRFEYVSNFTGDRRARDENEMVFMRTRVNVDADIADNVFARVEVQDFRRWGDPATNASATTTAATLSLREGYVELTSLAGDRLDVKLGRQAILFGDERLLGDLDWHRVGRTHDAATARIRLGENVKWNLLAIDVNEADQIGSTAAAKGGVDGDAYLLGAYGEIAFKPFTRLQPFWIYQDYDSSTLPALSPQVASSGSAGADLHVHTWGLLASGELTPRLAWNAEAHYQAGNFGTKTLSAFLLHGKLAWDAGRRHLAKIAVAYDVYSGDRAKSDNTIQTYQPVFPSYYEHIGRIGRFGMKNLDRIRATLAGTLIGDWRWRFDAHNFRLNERADDLYSTTGTIVYATGGGASREVGNEYDLALSYPWKPNVTFTATASDFVPGAAVRQAIRNAGGEPDRTIDVTTAVEIKF